MKFLENVARDLCACQRLVNFWDDDVVISRLWIQLLPLLIVPADKGRSVVVVDKDEYQEKVSVLLNDTNTYLKITDKRSNPTSSVEKDLNKLLLNIKEEKNDSGTQIGPAL